MMTSLSFQRSNFDFNDVDMLFLKRHIHNKFPTKIKNSFDTLRRWFEEVHTQEDVSVYYGAMIETDENQHPIHIAETITLFHLGDELFTANFDRAFIEPKKVKLNTSWEHVKANRKAIDDFIIAYNVATQRLHRTLLHSFRQMLGEYSRQYATVEIETTNPDKFIARFIVKRFDHLYTSSFTFPVSQQAVVGGNEIQDVVADVKKDGVE